MASKKEVKKEEVTLPTPEEGEAKLEKTKSKSKKLTQKQVDVIVDKVSGPIAKRQILAELKFKGLA